jgi:hypothetical protein
MKCIQDREGPKRTSVWIIQNSAGKLIGKIIAAYPRDGMGRLYLSLWDWTDPNHFEVQEDFAGGCGYHKVAACLSGMTFGGYTLLEDTPERNFARLELRCTQVL